MKVNNSYFITYLTGAFPDKNQRKELSKLSKIGHGQYHRLFYQIDQYTQEVKVNSKALILNNQTNNGPKIKFPILDFITNAISFQDLLNLLFVQKYGIDQGK